MILAHLQKLPNNVGDLGKIILATIFKWLPNVQKIAQCAKKRPIWSHWSLPTTENRGSNAAYLLSVVKDENKDKRVAKLFITQKGRIVFCFEGISMKK